MKRLGLVRPDEELTGRGPPAFERLARSCVVGSKEHKGVLSVCSALARRAVSACIVPSNQHVLIEPLASLQGFIRDPHAPVETTLSDLGRLRAQVFAAANYLEDATSRAVMTAQQHLMSRTEHQTKLAPHAHHVIERYVRLAAHFSCAAICHTLDAAHKPEQALEVLGDSSAALCYQATGLGPGRQPALLRAAVDQAHWEYSRTRESVVREDALMVQVFHEYLGGRFQIYMDAERAKQAQFIEWALSGRLSH